MAEAGTAEGVWVLEATDTIHVRELLARSRDPALVAFHARACPWQAAPQEQP